MDWVELADSWCHTCSGKRTNTLYGSGSYQASEYGNVILEYLFELFEFYQ